MTPEEIIEMAKEAGFDTDMPVFKDGTAIAITLAKLVDAKATAKEREACANLCWKSEDDNAFINAYNGKRLDLLCSDLIRARGEA